MNRPTAAEIKDLRERCCISLFEAKDRLRKAWAKDVIENEKLSDDMKEILKWLVDKTQL